MFYKIIDKSFELKTNREDIINFFNSRLERTEIKSDNYIEFGDKVIMKYDDKETIINGDFNAGDLYQIYNNYISMVVNDSNTLYIHSALISKNNKGLLLVGTFGQGKTTLSNESVKLGFTVNSSDHSILRIEDNKLYMICGSNYVREGTKVYNLPLSDTNKKIEVKEIELLYGLSYNGDVSFTELNKDYFVKTLYQYCSWHFNNPLEKNMNDELYNSKKEIALFLKKVSTLDIKTYIVRGDSEKIALNFEKNVDNE